MDGAGTGTGGAGTEAGIAPPLTVGFVAGVASASCAAVLGGGFVIAFLAYSVGGAAGIVGAAALAASRLSDDGDDDGRARARRREETREAHPNALPAFAGAAAPGRRR